MVTSSELQTDMGSILGANNITYDGPFTLISASPGELGVCQEQYIICGTVNWMTAIIAIGRSCWKTLIHIQIFRSAVTVLGNGPYQTSSLKNDLEPIFWIGVRTD